MKSVWKHIVDITDNQSVAIPEGAKFLSAQMQGSEIATWWIVNPGMPREQHRIVVVGTGNPCDDDISDWDFLGTVQWDMGLVWHLFDMGIEAPGDV